MNQKIKKLWVDALRSGKYKQTNGNLHDNIGFCCLGVLCDLHRKKMKKKNWFKSSDRKWFSYKKSETGVLPAEVADWANLDELNPKIDGCRLSVWNDDEKKSFNWIADAIEKEL